MLSHFVGEDDSPRSAKSTDSAEPALSQASVRIIPTNHRLGYSVDSKATLSSLAADEENLLPDKSDNNMSRSDSILQEAKFKISDVAVQVN